MPPRFYLSRGARLDGHPFDASNDDGGGAGSNV